jgi:hypothetical protein
MNYGALRSTLIDIFRKLMAARPFHRLFPFFSIIARRPFINYRQRMVTARTTGPVIQSSSTLAAE